MLVVTQEKSGPSEITIVISFRGPDTIRALSSHCEHEPMSPKTTNPRDPRVEIDPDLYRALSAEAILQDTTPKALVAQWIMDNLSPKTREFIAPGDHEPMSQPPQDVTDDHVTVEQVEVMDKELKKQREEYNKRVDEVFQGNEQMCFPANHTPEKQHRKVSAALKNQPAKIAKIKEIWATGERNRTEIARKVEVHPDAVTRWVADALKKGDLHE